MEILNLIKSIFSLICILSGLYFIAKKNILMAINFNVLAILFKL